MVEGYRYMLELARPGGHALGRFPLVPDWEPAIESARWNLLRSRHVWVPDVPSDRTVEPVWHSIYGAPLVERFRVRLSTDAGEWIEEFDALPYFAAAARHTSSRLREEGTLDEGDVVRYRPLAFEGRDTQNASGSLRFNATERTAAPRFRATSLDGFLARSVVAGDTGPDSFDAFVPHLLLDEVMSLTSQAGGNETGGILIGHLHRDPVRCSLFVEATAQISARHTESTSAKLTFTADTWTDVRATLALRRRDEQILGWWHSHPAHDWCKACPPERQRECPLAEGFLSTDDRALHRAIFPRAFSLALLVTHALVGLSTALFGWQSGLLAPRGFRILGAPTGYRPPVAAGRRDPVHVEGGCADSTDSGY